MENLRRHALLLFFFYLFFFYSRLVPSQTHNARHAHVNKQHPCHRKRHVLSPAVSYQLSLRLGEQKERTKKSTDILVSDSKREERKRRTQARSALKLAIIHRFFSAPNYPLCIYRD